MHADLVRRAREAADSLSGRQPEYVEHMCVSPGDPEGLDAADLLRELAQALESPVAQSVPVAVPEFHSVARRKLDSLLADGWSVNGYSIIKGEGRRGFVDFGGFVGWWLPEYYKGHSSDTTPQPASAGPVVTLRADADRAYIRYLDKMSERLCLGADHKLATGTFGRAELDAHVEARELFGYHKGIHAALKALSSPTPVGVSEDWRDDPSADDRWNAGLDYGQNQLCKVLGIDPQTVNWDAATETLDGDVQSVIRGILTMHFGDDWSALRSQPPAPKEQEPVHVEQPDYLYFECPECEFSSVQPRDFKGSSACPMCAGDSGHDVRMSSRVARATDKPEGKDARNVAAPKEPAPGVTEASKSDDLVTDEDRIAYWKGAYERMAARNVSVCSALKDAILILDDLASGQGLDIPIEQVIRDLNAVVHTGG